nr:ulp1 protease family, C-terminal catalytic domain-containing protein [Tanacetum cinerariifolium]
VVEQNEFDQNVADRNLIHDVNQAIKWKVNDETLNVAAECMSVDKNPSSGSDVKDGNKESMCVDSSVKTLCATDINANNVHNDSMDFDHDPKQNEFDQNVADRNLIHDVNQAIKWKVNDEVQREAKVSKERRGCQSDTHLDIWVLYLRHYRPAEADWAIWGPFFNTFMLGDKMLCCYVDRVTYGVSWFSEFVKKVYFLINVEDNHWILPD